ncbi:transketolase [Candidatus Woesearchaeota archaeon]|nr:transketolase [Candidatus Woesearchaeota archaeon]
MIENNLQELAKLIRYYILISTTEAGSGHPSTCLSAADLMTNLFFDSHLKADLNRPGNPNNDRIIFSKGHAAPLLYSLYAAAGKVSVKELLKLRKFKGPLEGHPTPAFRYTEAATGSLGQGLSIGVGMALNAKYLDKLPYKTFVLMGDSEMAEGSVWEAMALASHYKLDNLIGIIDVNRLGQRGETLYGHRMKEYKKKAASFGWKPIVIDGHNPAKISKAFRKARNYTGKPVMIIAKTIKGKGVSFIEDKEGWHGRALSKDELKQALEELGPVNLEIIGKVEMPENLKPDRTFKPKKAPKMVYKEKEPLATRKAYGQALLKAVEKYPDITVLDAEVSNSTYSCKFKYEYPERFFEMYIAEQNMAGAALGLSLRGKIPFVSSFAAFLTRAYDQIRMSQYSKANIKFVGSHAGVSIGEDGASQMGLEDISMFRSINGSVILYPSDSISTEKLVEAAARHKGNVYLRTTRADTPVLYKPNANFRIGGSKTLRISNKDMVTVVAAGITLHEALEAYKEFSRRRIKIRVIDLYSIKPLDEETLKRAARNTGAIIVVEDHYPEGGIGDAVRSVVGDICPVHHLAVSRLPRSGKPGQLMDYEGISSKAIIRTIRKIIKKG